MASLNDMPGLKSDSDTSDSDEDDFINANQSRPGLRPPVRRTIWTARVFQAYSFPSRLSRWQWDQQEVCQEFSIKCILCLGEVDLKPDTKIPCGIACPCNHLIHRECLDSLILDHCETVLRTPSTSSHIHCPACEENCNRSKPVQIQSYTEEQLKHACGGASQKALDLLECVAKADRDLAALPEDEQITKGNTDCYLCPKCNFGPVAHKACEDLSSHHDHGGISNKCPKCGYFASTISEWIQISAPEKPASRSPATWPRPMCYSHWERFFCSPHIGHPPQSQCWHLPPSDLAGRRICLVCLPLSALPLLVFAF